MATLYPHANHLTLSANINYPGSDNPKFLHWDTLNGTLCTTTGSVTNYLPLMITDSQLDMIPTADTGVNSNATWLEVQRSGLYYINACVIFDDQNTTAYYQVQLFVKRAGFGELFYHAQQGDGLILQSDIKAQNLSYLGRFDAGDSVTLMVTFTEALDLIAEKGSYFVKSRLEFSRIL